MKKLFQVILALAILLGVNQKAQAQFDFDSFLEAGINDANKLLESYLEPGFQGMGYGINGGWYNTARPHQTLGFELSFSASAAIVPSSAQFFTFKNSDYQNVRLSDNSRNQLPTLFGPNLGADDLPELTFLDPDTGQEVIRISAPTGLGIDETLPLNAVPTPMVQLSVGLFKGTDIKLRYVPATTFGEDDDAEVELFGLGVMHDIKQHIPVIKALPFDLSIFAGFTNLKTTLAVDASVNQFAEIETKGVILQALVSKKLAFITAYGGIGYSKASTTFNLLGTYTTETSTFTDPINLAYDNNGVRANVGLRLRLLFFNIFGEYAFQTYNTATVGIGFSFREGKSSTNIPIVPGI
jgi:hypothetical protein